MLDHKVSPLLDAMEVGECFARHDGASCYEIRHPASGRVFVLKHISIPAGAEQVEALLLTGAYASEEEADAYYRKEAVALVQEAENRKRLLDCPYILPFLGVQMEKKAGVGYDIFAVLPKRNSLETYLVENAVSHLRGINMGIDLCVALSALREQGYVHGNLKPGNVFFSDTGRFLLGDFGLISTEDMQYAILPEQYRSCYSAPELNGILGGLNPTVDIYSLGMILYRIYNGNHAPFEDEQTSPRAADAKREAGEALPAPIYADYELASIICKACAFDPADRYQSPEQMRVELEQYMRRNAVSDHLIVPPLVTDGIPLTPEEAEAEAEPVRFADPDQLDENFKKAFSPAEDRNGGKKSGKKNGKKGGKRQPKQTAEQKSAPERAEEPPAEERPAVEPPQVLADRHRIEQKLRQAQKRRKRTWGVLALAVLLLAVCIALYECTDLGKGRWHYFARVDALELSDVTADSLRLHISTNVNPADFTVYCRDDYGNVKTGSFTDETALFEELRPNTPYRLELELPGFHKLSGATTASVTTKTLTEITSFRILPGDTPGSAQLELAVRDSSTAPAFWTLRYGKTGEEATELQFAGNSYGISDLEIDAPYTFTLVQTDKLYLTGLTQVEYTPILLIDASNLHLEEIEDGVARLSWSCGADLPAEWELSCTDSAKNSLPVEIQQPVPTDDGWRCTATVSGLIRDTDYSVSLSARGLTKPLTTTLRDVGIRLSAFTGEATSDGLVLQWSADQTPEAGWRITAAFDGDRKLETVVQGSGCTMAVLPDIDYSVSIAPADGAPVIGENSLQLRSQSSRRFVQMGVNQRTTIGLYKRPDKEGYTYADLDLTGTVRFRATDPVCFGIVAGGWPADSEQIVTVHYVVRDAKTDKLLSVAQDQAAWNSLWESDHFVGDLRAQWLPQTPGSYAFTVYVNSQRMGTINFTIIE